MKIIVYIIVIDQA